MAKKGIWAIAGGKGGVGKSFLCSNLSIDLAQRGNSVVLIDADFGGPNLHTFMGISTSIISVSDFIKNTQLNLDDILIPTGIPNLKLASGAQDVLGMANLNIIQQNKLIKA
ncbi:MAG: P-loop NTPase, partial [SAR324 cluster bacterium]|nr:P-loop NTPase [SAR324 cluster bacterium]